MAQLNAEFLFVRHGNAVKSAGDADRRLTPLGKEQAAKFRDAIQTLGWFPNLVLVSPAERAKETARIIAPADVFMIEMPEIDVTLKEGWANTRLMEVWGRLGNVPLNTHLREDLMPDILRDYGERASRAIVSATAAPGATRVLVVGHALLLPAVAYAMVCWLEDAEPALHILRHSTLEECCGIYIRQDGSIQFLNPD